MKRRALIFVCTTLLLHATASTALAEDAPPADAPPASTAMATPAITPPLTANPNPYSLDLGPLGKTTITGAVTGLALAQDNHVPGDRAARGDLSNGQVFLQKTDGLVQYYLQVGTYSLPTLGTPYLTASKTVDAYYGAVPQAYLKLAPSAEWSFLAGKLPTLIGAEYTFTFQNSNVERGLLWNQENAVTRGVQANYTSGPLAVSAAWTDGFYSNRYDWLSASVAYTFDPANILSFIAGANLNRTGQATSATPPLQNNSQIYNIFYTHTAGAWTWQSYLQYTRVPAAAEIGTTHSASTLGAAVFANYAFSPQFTLGGRAEYITSSGDAFDGTPNLLYGPGSSAWSFTLTPTWQLQRFFVRGELSYVKASDAAPGASFGTSGAHTAQSRALVEAGVLF